MLASRNSLYKCVRSFSTASVRFRQLRSKPSSGYTKRADLGVGSSSSQAYRRTGKNSYSDRETAKILRHTVIRSDSRNFVRTNFDTIKESDVCRTLKDYLLQGHQTQKVEGDFATLEDELKYLLQRLEQAALDNKDRIYELMSASCARWNPLNEDLQVDNVLKQYRDQVLSRQINELEYPIPKDLLVRSWTDISEVHAFFQSTKIFPSIVVLERARDELQAKSKLQSSYAFLMTVAEYLSSGFLRFYARRAQNSLPTVLQSRWKRIDLLHPENLYPFARCLTRKIYLHIGPTNSGKTYTALQSFQNAKSGFYAGPLRLLAREVYNRLNSSNKACNLKTGDEIINEYTADGEVATLTSGTIEMMDLTSELDVAVIDEIQMIEDKNRGWAWTRAVLGVRAKVLHLCGDANSEQIIRKLVQLTGDELKVIRYERLSGLVASKQPLKDPLNHLERGDCVVFFSKRELLTAKKQIESITGHKCAIIYGSLPAETRSRQALAFNDPNSDYHYLVASDAIGMGLNLAIKRIIFSKATKFNGKYMESIPVAQTKQIAGRAGRFHVPGAAMSDDKPLPGVVTAVTQKDLKYVAKCLKQDSPVIQKAAIFPEDEFLADYANSLGPEIPFHEILSAVSRMTQVGKHFFFPSLSDSISVAELFADVRGLTLEEKILLFKAPVPLKNELAKVAFVEFCKVIANGGVKTLMEIPYTSVGYLGQAHIPVERPADVLESVYQTICLYLWLSYRFPNNFLDQQGAIALRDLCEERINSYLTDKARPLVLVDTDENEVEENVQEVKVTDVL